MTAEELINSIESECNSLAKEIIDKVCRRAMREMNSRLGFIINDDYPNTFRFIDYLACEIQSKSYNEIFFPGNLLENYINETLDKEYDNLTVIEKMVLSYADFTPQAGEGYDWNDPQPQIFTRFNELLNEHWVESKKIQHFEETRTW